MPTITLPDGSERRFDGPVTGAEVAASIGPGLARAAEPSPQTTPAADRSG